MPESKFIVVKLHFEGGLHLAGRSEDFGKSRAYPGSDSLKAALCACFAQLQGNHMREEAMTAFMDGFRLSSAFPFDAKGLFLPIPIGLWPLETVEMKLSASASKQIRKLEYLRLADFVKYFIEGDWRHTLNPAEQEILQYAESVQHVRVAKPWEGQTDARPYMQERRTWGQGSGLYFLLNVETAQHNSVMAALQLLADQGMGLRKSIGGGAFRFEISDLEIAQPAETAAKAWMSLGRYLPQLPEGKLPQIPLSYRLCDVKGYMAGASTFEARRSMRKRIYMLGEGSLFAQDPQADGRCIDLAPENAPHPAWRDGRCLFLPILFNPNLKLPENAIHS